ncbi:hypothetical protein [Streptomyces sp. SM10]|uniref:hypothetical protein n=1 Tax=Streptomyces sp. SM10 TaxID=565556 RepID=UPI0015E19D71|nr:hypothetical protein [Streptomyces sp. SM10]
MPRNGRTRTLGPISLILIGSLALAGCGGDHEAGSSSAEATSVEVIPGVLVKSDPALHAGLGEQTRRSGVVWVATDLPYPPSRCSPA